MDPDERHDDFHDLRWEAGTSEQDTPVAENPPDGGSRTRARSQPHPASSTPEGRNENERHASGGSGRAAQLAQERAARSTLYPAAQTVDAAPIDPPIRSAECGFCHGKPVGNAASWLDGKPRPPAACPRCGEVNWPEDFEEALDALSKAALTPAPETEGQS